MAGAIFFQALREYARFRRLWPWILCSLFGFVMVKVWSASDPQGVAAIECLVVTFFVTFRVLGLSAAVLATANISGEVEQKTIVYLLTRPVPRWMLLVMRFLAASIIVFALTTLCALAVSVAAYGLNLGANPILGHEILAIALGSLAYCGLFTLLSLMLSKAMIYCLVYAFIWELIVPAMPGTMYYMSIFSHIWAATFRGSTANADPNFLAGSVGTNTLTPTVAMVVLALIPVVTIALGAWWFTQFEYVPREDEA